MWCSNCESEVATQLAADGQSLLCVSCGSQVRRLNTPSLHPDIRRAREILDRLSAASAPGAPMSPDDEPAELDDLLAAAVPAPAENEPAELELPPAPKQFRVDRAHPFAEVARTHVSGETPGSATTGPRPPQSQRSDPRHPALPPPHFDVQAARPRSVPGRGESTWGQLMAYAGVAVLTIGTSLVVWGYLGGPASYAPTGWLVATAGQMLLLLGVVTLVAGGMQQTTHEVSSRVANLNGRVIRIEQTANELLRGPHFGGAGERAASAATDSQETDGGQDSIA